MREPYVIISTDRLALGRRVRPDDVLALLDRYAPTAILPTAWTDYATPRVLALTGTIN